MPTTNIKRSWTRAEKILATTIAVAAVLAVALWAFFNNRDADPVVHIPTPVMPSPNGYDYALAAANASFEGPPMYNATTRRWVNVAQAVKDPRMAAMARALVKRNAVAVGLLHKGFQFPYLCPPVRSFSAPILFAQYRKLARVLAFQSQLCAARGDAAGMVDNALDAMELGQIMPRGGGLLCMLVGDLSQAIGREPVWDNIALLDARQCRRAVSRLQRIETEHVPFADILQEEEWTGQAGLMETFHQPNWKNALPSGNATPSGASGLAATPSAVKNLRAKLRIQIISKKMLLADYTSWMDVEIADARRPYGTSHLVVDKSDPIMDVLVSDDGLLQFKDAETEALNLLLSTALALRAYRLEHGVYPTALSQLVAGHLGAVPLDPFTASSPLLYYKTQANSYVLYSVGPDMHDDGGTPIPGIPEVASNGKHWIRRFIVPNSRGDIVAGVNE
jgi:hypothetical protein